MIRTAKRLQRIVGLCGSCLAFCPIWLSAAETQIPTPAQLQGWVQGLAADRFSQREASAQRLLAAGDLALPALDKASEHVDREIRDRALQIQQILRRRRRQRVLTAFRENVSGAAPTLPGWSTFAKQYGESARSRKFYAELLQAEWSLLAAVYQAESPNDRTDVLSDRYQEIQRSGSAFFMSAGRGTVLTLFWLATEFPAEFGEHGALFGFISSPDIQRVLLAGEPA